MLSYVNLQSTKPASIEIKVYLVHRNNNLTRIDCDEFSCFQRKSGRQVVCCVGSEHQEQGGV